MSRYFYHDRVLVLRPGTKTNRAQETVLDYSGLEAVAGFPRDRVHLREVGQGESPAEDRIAATTEWMIATEPGSGDWDVLESDWLRLPDGQIAAVQGPPARASDPATGLLHHVEVRARRTAG